MACAGRIIDFLKSYKSYGLEAITLRKSYDQNVPRRVATKLKRAILSSYPAWSFLLHDPGAAGAFPNMKSAKV